MASVSRYYKTRTISFHYLSAGRFFGERMDRLFSLVFFFFFNSSSSKCAQQKECRGVIDRSKVPNRGLLLPHSFRLDSIHRHNGACPSRLFQSLRRPSPLLTRVLYYRPVGWIHYTTLHYCFPCLCSSSATIHYRPSYYCTGVKFDMSTHSAYIQRRSPETLISRAVASFGEP